MSLTDRQHVEVIACLRQVRMDLAITETVSPDVRKAISVLLAELHPDRQAYSNAMLHVISQPPVTVLVTVSPEAIRKMSILDEYGWTRPLEMRLQVDETGERGEIHLRSDEDLTVP